MKPFATCVFVALLSGALASPEGVSRWESFKSKHAKQHAAHEEPERMRAFLERDAEIQAHNERYARGEESYSRQHSQYSDLSIQEFRKFALGFVPAKNASDIPFAVQGPAMPSLPESFSWKDQGVMTSVKNQLYCGSCYAFAGAGALEGYLKWKSGQEYDLAEQDVVDCSYRKFMGGAHNNGCEGGWPDAVYDHYNVKDLIHETEYPYTSGRTQQHGRCNILNPRRNVVQGKLRYTNQRVRNENDIREYLVSKGPLVVALAADNAWKPFFDDLGDGVFDNRGSINAQPNHAVVLVGYGNHKGKDYWLIKNSWGADWATGGYGKIARGKNMCGIATFGVWYIQ